VRPARGSDGKEVESYWLESSSESYVNYLWAVILVLTNTVWLVLDLLGLPGNWLMVAGALLVAWLQPEMFSVWTLVAIVSLAAAGEVLELLSGALGARKGGAGRQGSIAALLGGVIGAIAGTFVIPIPVLGSLIGACAGACLGAWIIEMSGGRDFRASLRAGVGAGVGRAVGTVIKLGVGILLWLFIAIAAFVP
jgi:uncharacterized protein YqgC (DUF456 family)